MILNPACHRRCFLPLVQRQVIASEVVDVGRLRVSLLSSPIVPEIPV